MSDKNSNAIIEPQANHELRPEDMWGRDAVSQAARETQRSEPPVNLSPQARAIVGEDPELCRVAAEEVERRAAGSAEYRQHVREVIDDEGERLAAIDIQRARERLAKTETGRRRLAEIGVSPDGAAPAADPGLPTQLLGGGNLLDAKFPPVEFAIHPYFPKAEITEVVGAHGIFKSTVSLYACLAKATGRPWADGPVTKDKSAFITLEDGERTLHWRVRAWLDAIPSGQERDDAESDVRANFQYLAREHARGLALTVTVKGATTIAPSVVELLGGLLAGRDLAVLETASRLHDGPEMNEALAVFAQAVEEVAIASGAAVVVVRHVSKQAARDQVIDSYAGRGGGSFSDAARSVLVMTRDRKPEEDEEGIPDPLAPVRLTHAKSILSAPGPRLVWKPEKRERGVYLRPLTGQQEATDAVKTMREHMRQVGELVEGDLKKKGKDARAGLSQSLAREALRHLVDAGEVERVSEKRGRTGQDAVVYRRVQKGAGA